MNYLTNIKEFLPTEKEIKLFSKNITKEFDEDKTLNQYYKNLYIENFVEKYVRKVFSEYKNKIVSEKGFSLFDDEVKNRLKKVDNILKNIDSYVIKKYSISYDKNTDSLIILFYKTYKDDKNMLPLKEGICRLIKTSGWFKDYEFYISIKYAKERKIINKPLQEVKTYSDEELEKILRRDHQNFADYMYKINKDKLKKEGIGL